MDPGLIVGIVGAGLTALAAYVAWEQLRRTPKRTGKPLAELTTEVEQLEASHLAPRLEHPSQVAVAWVGREEELDELTSWLFAESGPPVCCVEGIIGAGKTALVWKWLYERVLPEEKYPPLDGLMQWSFTHDRTSLGDFLLVLCGYLGLTASGQDLIVELRDALSQRRLLIVLDGFEYLLSAYASKFAPSEESPVGKAPGDDRAVADVLTARWLQMLTTLTGSRALLVSRFVPSELESTARCRRLVLRGFSSDEAVRYLRARSVKGSSAELAAAAEFYGRHPLSLDRLANVLRYDITAPGDISRARIGAAAVETELTERQGHVFQEAFHTLPPDTQHFLGTLSAIRGSVPVVLAREAVPWASENTIRAWLRRLEEDHWLDWDREHNVLGIHPLVRRCAYAELADRSGVHERLRTYFARVAPEELTSRTELESLIELFHQTVKVGWLDQAAELFFARIYRSLSFRYGMMLTVVELLGSLFTEADHRRPSVRDERLQFRILDTLAYAYRVNGKSRLVLPLYQSAASIARERGWLADLAFGQRNILRQQMLLGDLAAAFEAGNQHAQVASAAGDRRLTGISHRDLGMLCSIVGDYAGADDELARADEIFGALGDARRQGMVWTYRARLARWRGDVDASLRAAHRARELASAEGRERDSIWAEWQLGGAHRLAGAFRAAEDHLVPALDSSRRNGMTDLEPGILLELSQLRLAQRNRSHALGEGAVDYAEEAMMIAERSEFRLAQADAHSVLARIALRADRPDTAGWHVARVRELAVCGEYTYQSALDAVATIGGQVDARRPPGLGHRG